jgi:hypothetical protein
MKMNRLVNNPIDCPTLFGGVLHVRFVDRSFDMSMPGLELGPESCDEQVRFAVAEYLEIPSYRLDGYVVERHENGDLTIRPETIFRLIE